MHRFRSPMLALLLISTLAVACDSNEDSPEQEAPDPQTVAASDYTAMESGLRYHDLTEGDGAEATSGDRVTVHYNGWLEADSTLFDSSIQRGQPFSFELGTGQVIRGWDEGVAGMKVGGERQLVIPPDLAYGSQGAGDAIPPDATLIFEVELLSVDSGS